MSSLRNNLFGIIFVFISLTLCGCSTQPYLWDSPSEEGKKNCVKLDDIRVHFAPEWLKYYEIGLELMKNECYDDAVDKFMKSIELRADELGVTNEEIEDSYNVRVQHQHYVRYFPNRELGIVYFWQSLKKATSEKKDFLEKKALVFLNKSLNFKRGHKTSNSKTTLALYYKNRVDHELNLLGSKNKYKNKSLEYKVELDEGQVFKLAQESDDYVVNTKNVWITGTVEFVENVNNIRSTIKYLEIDGKSIINFSSENFDFHKVPFDFSFDFQKHMKKQKNEFEEFELTITAGRVSKQKRLRFILDDEHPVINILKPFNKEIVYQDEISLEGEITDKHLDKISVFLNGTEQIKEKNYKSNKFKFSTTLVLNEGLNKISIRSWDKGKNYSCKKRHIYYYKTGNITNKPTHKLYASVTPVVVADNTNWKPKQMKSMCNFDDLVDLTGIENLEWNSNLTLSELSEKLKTKNTLLIFINDKFIKSKKITDYFEDLLSYNRKIRDIVWLLQPFFHRYEDYSIVFVFIGDDDNNDKIIEKLAERYKRKNNFYPVKTRIKGKVDKVARDKCILGKLLDKKTDYTVCITILNSGDNDKCGIPMFFKSNKRGKNELNRWFFSSKDSVKENYLLHTKLEENRMASMDTKDINIIDMLERLMREDDIVVTAANFCNAWWSLLMQVNLQSASSITHPITVSIMPSNVIGQGWKNHGMGIY